MPMLLKKWIACLFLLISIQSMSQDSILHVDEEYLDKVAEEVLLFRKEDSLKKRSAIKLLLKSENLDSIAKGYYELGAFYWVFDQLDSGLIYKKEAASRFEELKDYDNQIKALRYVGWIYMTQFQYTEALQYYLQAKEVCKNEKVDSVGVSLLDKAIGTLYNYQGDFIKSREYYEKSYNFFVQGGCSEGLSSSYNCLAIQSYDEEDYEQEFELTQKAFDCASTLDTNEVFIRMALNMGNIHSRHGNYENAIKHYYIALAGVRASRSKSLKNISLTLLHFAWLQKQNGNFESALRLYDKAEKWIKKSDRKKEMYLSRVYKWKSKIYAEIGNHKAALENHQQYIKVLNVVNNTESALKMANLEKEYLLKVEQEQLTRANVKMKWMTFSIVLLVLLILAIIFYRKKIEVAEGDLVQRNIEIIELEAESDTNQASISNRNEKKYASSALESEHKEELLQLLIQLMEKEKLYMNSDLTIGLVADQLNSNRRYLSQTVNELLHKNFSSFINQYRIQEARRRMGAKEFENYTIEAIARDTGFKSISSFNSAFSKFTGVTPSVFFKKMKAVKKSPSEKDSFMD